MPHRAHTPDTQTPGESATHTFEPGQFCVGYLLVYVIEQHQHSQLTKEG